MRGASLRAIAGPAVGSELELGDGEFMVGRESVTGNPLSQDLEISRRHARIIRAGAVTVIEDLGSSNGTFLNGQRITSRQVLVSGDEVRVGRTVLVLEDPQQATVVRPQLPEPEVHAPDERAPAPARARPQPPRTRNNGIAIQGLVREFGIRRVVDGIDLQVAPGAIQGFLGPNGAGKSTTVHMLTTLLPPTGGTASIAVTTSSRRARACAPRSASRCRKPRSIR